MKTITWTEANNWHDAYYNGNKIGSCYKSVENVDRYYWVSGSKNGFQDSLIEAMKKVEDTYKEKL